MGERCGQDGADEGWGTLRRRHGARSGGHAGVAAVWPGRNATPAPRHFCRQGSGSAGSPRHPPMRTMRPWYGLRVRGDWQNRAINHVPAWQGSSAAYPAVQLVSRAGMLLLPATIPSDRDAPLPEVRGIHQCGRCDRDWRVSCTVDPADAKEAALVWQGSSAAYPAVQLVSQAGMPPRAKALLSQGCAAAGSPAGEGISQGHTPPPAPCPIRQGPCPVGRACHRPAAPPLHTSIIRRRARSILQLS